MKKKHTKPLSIALTGPYRDTNLFLDKASQKEVSLQNSISK